MSLKDQIDERDQEGVFDGGKIELPFDTLYFAWGNGSAQANKEALSGAAYFGGWYTDSVKALDMGIAMLPRLYSEEWYDKNGAMFPVYANRFLTVSVIAKRERWVIDKDKPGDRGRGHGQILCLCANTYKDDQKVQHIDYWMPIVLTAKGLAFVAIQNAFKEFEKATTEIRATKLYAAPAWYFWCHIGTFGAERTAKMVGKGSKSPIVEAQILISQDLTQEKLESHYIGDQLCDLRRQLRHDAEEWLHAWDKQEENAANKQQTSSTAPAVKAPPRDDQIPF